MASGLSSALYAFDPQQFHVVADPAWVETARLGGFRGFLHPYVQTPLWAWLLRPACEAVSFDTFRRVFVLAALVALIVTLRVAAAHWAPRFTKWWWAAGALVVLALTTPFQYAMYLAQTHALFVALSVLALVTADRGRAATAGIALAAAATVKLTPALLVIYWAVRGQWRALLWFVLASMVLVAATWATSGLELFQAYLKTVGRISNVLLVSFNNQSLPAWWHGRAADPKELWAWTMLALPTATKLVTTALAVLVVVGGGLIDRNVRARGAGAAVALVGLTAFTSLAWSHYYIVLLPAMMVLVDRSLQDRRLRWGLLAVLVVVLLNVRPFAVNPFHFGQVGSIAVVRSHFFSALLAIAALCCLEWYRRSAQCSERATTRAIESGVTGT